MNQRPKDYESRAVFRGINSLRAHLFRKERNTAPLQASNGAVRFRIAERAIVGLVVWFAVCLLVGCGGGGSSTPPADPGVPEPYVIAAYGDSTQEAQGQPHAASRPGAKIYNRGVSGTNSAQLLAGTDGRNLPWAEQMRVESARIVVINHGINDRGRAVEDYKADLRALVEGIRKVGKVPMLEEPNPINEPGFDDYRNAMKHVANHMGVYFCAQPRVPLVDGIHPTSEGYAIKTGRLAKCIGDVL